MMIGLVFAEVRGLTCRNRRNVGYIYMYICIRVCVCVCVCVYINVYIYIKMLDIHKYI
jgi:hypothetical protein